MPYEDFPWFNNAAIEAALKAEMPSPGNFYRPVLDTGLMPEIIEQPGRFLPRAKMHS